MSSYSVPRTPDDFLNSVDEMDTGEAGSKVNMITCRIVCSVVRHLFASGAVFFPSLVLFNAMLRSCWWNRKKVTAWDHYFKMVTFISLIRFDNPTPFN